jgi:cytochrome o ubiquinol oxidase subunit II
MRTIQLPTIQIRMKLRHKIAVVVSLILVCAIAWISVKGNTIALLQPKGSIAQQQYDLLLFASLLSLVIVIPVFALTGFIVWRYREDNKKAAYKPEWGGNLGLELVWWGIPLILISILAVITWQTSHSLDPFKPLNSTKEPVKIQVVALQWKWLFIYPEENIATVNYIRVPVDRPINFEITADAPMNSFWIPQLGGQIYAMNGMTTKLHLQANTPGIYDGSSANISGEGFADMKFKVEATSEKSYNNWLNNAVQAQKVLDTKTYEQLAKPGVPTEKTIYRLGDKTLFSDIINTYMGHGSTETTTHHKGMKY